MSATSASGRMMPTIENYVSALNNPLFPDLSVERPEARDRRRLRRHAVRHAGGLCPVALPASATGSLVMIGLLAFQMISPLVIMVPLYRYMDRLGLTDSHAGAIMIYIAISAPLFTWMLKGFLDGIPQSLEDAAMIDGCTRFGAFMRVILPLSLPGRHLGLRPQRHPRLVAVHRPLHPDQQAAAAADRRRHLQLPGHRSSRPRRRSWPPPACSPSFRPSSSSSSCSASSSAR